MIHSFLKRKSFKNFFQQTIQKKLDNYLLPFMNYVSEAGAQVDLEDALNMFTFDNTCTIAFAFYPNCLPNKFSELREIAYQKSLTLMEEVILYRHFIPNFLWKLQRWIHVGQEKKFKVAQESIDRFLYERISAQTKEGYGKAKMSEKYLRDSALFLLMAGNGTASSGLSWFFWLVSTHHVVEAKIVQEIKDNWMRQEENRITSREEYLNKLVYLDGAICEALRLYPPIPFEHICAIKSDILPSTGDHVSPNTRLMYSLYAMGRMEQIWGEGFMEFKLEKWISARGHVTDVLDRTILEESGKLMSSKV